MAENKHAIEGIMYTALQGLKEMIDVNTIVGDAITAPDGTVIIPISKVAIGFGVGGSEFEKTQKSGRASGEQEPKSMFGGGTGGGISLTPEAFLVVGNGKIRMLPVTPQSSVYDRLMDMAPEAIDKVAEIFGKKKKVEVNAEDLDEEDFSAQNPDA